MGSSSEQFFHFTDKDFQSLIQPEAENKGLFLRKEFAPFIWEEVHRSQTAAYHGFDSIIVLQASPQVRFPISLNAHDLYSHLSTEFQNAFPKHRVNAVTPFAPGKGYQISPEDYSTESRTKKLRELLREKTLTVQPPDEFPLWFFAATPENYFFQIDKGAHAENGSWLGFTDSSYEACLLCLRMQASFPNGLIFEASANPLLFEEGRLVFTHFYPLEKGPLANLEEKNAMALAGAGVALQLPDDLSQLSRIGVKFTLAD